MTRTEPHAEILPNGARVIAHRPAPDGRIVLAQTPEGDFATWLDGRKGTVWGHYFDDLEEAHNDLGARARRGY